MLEKERKKGRLPFLYFHQCQMQLYVGRDLFRWCDFIVATATDLFIQRITLDMEWVARVIPELEDFCDCFFLPIKSCVNF